MSLLDELQRRNVPRIALAYLAGSWFLIQVAETLLPIFGRDEAAARTLVVVLGIGLVPVLVLAWLYQWTPDGFRLDRSGEGSSTAISPSVHEGTRQLDRVIIVTLALAVGYFAIDKFALDPARDARLAETVARQTRAEALEQSYGQRSIAVLAFRSSDPDQAGFAEGISEELVHTLGGLPEVRVAAASSAFAMRDVGRSASEIGEMLGVSHLLEGSVRSSGDTVRITTRLVDAATDTQVWSKSYNRRLDDVFAIQDEIAESVVRELEVTLFGEIPRTRRTNPEAYQLYLQARYLLRTGSDLDEDAEELLERALAHDSTYAPAMLALARVYNRKAFDDPEIYRLRTRDLVRRVLEIEPGNGLAHGWLAWFASFYDRDLVTGARQTERAIALDPSNVDQLHGAQQQARVLGRPDIAVTLGRYEVLLDPICARCFAQLGRSYHVVGNWEAAEEALRTAERLDPSFVGEMAPAFDLGLVELGRGDPAAALAEFRRLEQGAPLRAVGIALASHTRGDRDAFDAAVDSLARLEDAARWLAPVHAWAGNADEAFAALAEAAAAGLGTYRFISPNTDPVYRSLHGDPRWAEYLEMIGYPLEEVAAAAFDPEIPPVITAALVEAGYTEYETP